MCYGCESGKYKGLTIVINNEINYQNLNIDSIKKLDKDIINRASSIHNIPLKYLLDKEKFSILEPLSMFVN